MTTVQQVYEVMQRLAPPELAEQQARAGSEAAPATPPL